MNSLKSALVSPPVFTLPDATGQMTLDTDPFDVQVSYVLHQAQTDESTKPIGYWSRSLTDAERKYDTTQWEYLAIVWAVLLLHSYFEGSRFTIRTDHDSLK